MTPDQRRYRARHVSALVRERMAGVAARADSERRMLTASLALAAVDDCLLDADSRIAIKSARNAVTRHTWRINNPRGK